MTRASDTLPKGGDGEAGSVRSKGSAVGGEADEAPGKHSENTPHSNPVETQT